MIGYYVKFPIQISIHDGANMTALDLQALIGIGQWDITFVREISSMNEDGCDVRFTCYTCKSHSYDWHTTAVPFTQKEAQQLIWYGELSELFEKAFLEEMKIHVQAHSMFGQIMVRELAQRGLIK